MSLIENVLSLIEQRSAIELELIELREEFQAYLVDRDIPIAERWSAYEKAPECLLNSYSFYTDLPHDLFGVDINDMFASRYETRSGLSIADSAIDMTIGWPTTGSLEEEAEINQIKEIFLREALGECTYDW